MEDNRTLCVICAWRQVCKKKFSMDGATTTRCIDFTRDITLKPHTEKQSTESEHKDAD
jgi:hypothetical protein